MKSSLFLAAVLAATTAWASPAPSPSRLMKRGGIGHSHRAMPVPEDNSNRNSSHYVRATEYYLNWSGAIQTANAGDVFTAVSARFAVPTPSVPSGKPAGSYSGAAWVGIDGADGTSSLWQAGADWSVDNRSGKNVYHYGVWYEWLPNALIEIPNFPVAAGHIINVNLVSTSRSTGRVVIIDETSHQTTTITTSAPNPTATLQGKTVEWITEDLSSGGGLVPFANYHSVAYKNCSFRTASGGFFNVASATLADLVDQQGHVISNSSRPSSSEIDTKYIG